MLQLFIVCMWDLNLDESQSVFYLSYIAIVMYFCCVIVLVVVTCCTILILSGKGCHCWCDPIDWCCP